MRHPPTVPFSEMKILSIPYPTLTNDDRRAKTSFNRNYKDTVSYTADEWLTWRKEAIACEICGFRFKTLTSKQGDHNHETGAWRGVLCWQCNAMVGWVEKMRKNGLDKKIENYLDTRG
jgi:hypothetical protein